MDPEYPHSYDLDRENPHNPWPVKKSVWPAQKSVGSIVDDIKESSTREDVAHLYEKLEKSCALGLQHRKERDQHFQNFREACRVGKQHREERNGVTRRLAMVMKENQKVREQNQELQDRIDGLYRALHHKPFDDAEERPAPKGTHVYLYLTLVASAVASLPIAQAIYVAATGTGIF